MALNTNGTAWDGTRITINEFIKDPLLIQAYVLNMLKQGWIVDAVLRHINEIPGGVAGYRESNPLYADTEAAVRAEGAEPRIAQTSLGELRFVYAVERALSVQITDEMKRHRKIDDLRIKLIQLKNTMFKAWDDTFMQTMINHPGVNTLAVAKQWADPTARIRSDILEAQRLVEEASPAGHQEGSEFDFDADTLIIGKGTKSVLLDHEQFNKVYEGDLADENLQYTGKLPQKILGLDTLVSARVPAGRAIVLQRGIAGFIADDLPLTVTPTYRYERRKSWFSDVQRASAVGLDQPKAITVLSGI